MAGIFDKGCLISLTLVVVAFVGCRKQQPLTCEATRYLVETVENDRKVIKSISDVDWTGREILPERIQSKPKYITFHEPHRITVDWLSYGHVWTIMELIYSPSEAKARIIKPESEVGDAYPLIVRGEGTDRHVRFGFFSTLCEREDSALKCMERSDLKFLVVEMECKPLRDRKP